MASPAYGLGWILWRKHRIGFTLFAAYLITVALVLHAAPLFSKAALPILTTPFGFGMLYVMAVFANSDTDLASTGSGYSYPLFTLPVRTASLVFWPMLYGTVTVAAVWIFYAAFVLAPSGSGAVLWWPAALAAALTASLQALAWHPVPLPYLRGILAFIVLAVMLGLAAAGSSFEISGGILSLCYLSVIPFAAWIAVRGVRVSRAGESREHSWLPERKTSGNAVPDFGSPGQAQFWLEWRRNGPMLPLITLLVCLLLAAPVVLAIRDTGNQIPLGIGGIQVHATVRLWLVSLLFTPIIAMAIGSCPNKAEMLRPDLSLQPFLATRPLSSANLVLAKLKLAAWSTLSAWGVVLIFLAGWLLLPGQDQGTKGTLGGLLCRYMTFKPGLAIAMLLVCLVVGTWQCQISALWVEMSGRRWLVNTYSVGIPMATAALIGWSVDTLSTQPLFAMQMLPFLKGIAPCLAILKGLSILAACFVLRRTNLASAAALGKVLLGWLLTFLTLWALWVWLLPKNLIPAAYTALGVFLFLPLARLLAAPLSLHWNRHR